MMNDTDSSSTQRPTRPRRIDDVVVRAAVTRHVQQIAEWRGELDEGGGVDHEWVDDLVFAVMGEHNAFEVCRQLHEDCGAHEWMPDAQLVAIVADVVQSVDAEYDATVRRWVAEVGPQPEFEVGDVVRWHRIRMHAAGTYTGEIAEVDSETAQYIVERVDALSVDGPLVVRVRVNFEDAWRAT